MSLGAALAACTVDPGDNPFDLPAATSIGAPEGSTGGTGDPGTGNPGSGDPTAGADGSSGESDDPGSGIKLDVASPDTDGNGPGEGSGEGCSFIDLLFVVDISASMNEEKANLDANFPSFVQVMDDYVADPTNNALGYRLGVTNSSVVDNGADQSTMGLDGRLFAGTFTDCGTAGTPWLDGPDAAITANFSCLAPNPISDCMSCSDFGRERPLDVLEMFIDKSTPGGPNEGFYRGDDALLVIVLLTDEDDDAAFTTTTPAATKAAIDAFAGGEERYVVVTIAGPPAGQCNSAFGSASAAPLLHEFTGLVPNGLMGDICQGDLAASLEQALELIQLSCDSLPPPAG
ncbi:MAG: hypothetical protein AAGF11_27555 [Myxococcota bacterium]